MRNTDDPNPPPMRPLGEKVTKPMPASPPNWQPKPNAPGIESDANGRLRTNIPGNDRVTP